MVEGINMPGAETQQKSAVKKRGDKTPIVVDFDDQPAGECGERACREESLADRFWNKQEEGPGLVLMDKMRKEVRAAIDADGTITWEVNPDGIDEEDWERRAAYEAIAEELGYGLGEENVLPNDAGKVVAQVHALGTNSQTASSATNPSTGPSANQQVAASPSSPPNNPQNNLQNTPPNTPPSLPAYRSNYSGYNPSYYAQNTPKKERFEMGTDIIQEMEARDEQRKQDRYRVRFPFTGTEIPLFSRLNRFFNDTNTGKNIKLGCKVVLGGAAVATSLATGGAAGMLLAPLLYTGGIKSMVSGGIEAFQEFAGRRSSRNMRAELAAQKENFYTLLQSEITNLQNMARSGSFTEDELQEAFNTLHQRSEDFERNEIIRAENENINTEKGRQKFRSVVSSLASAAIGFFAGVPLGSQNFDGDKVNHLVTLGRDGCNFHYNGAQELAEATKFATEHNYPLNTIMSWFGTGHTVGSAAPGLAQAGAALAGFAVGGKAIRDVFLRPQNVDSPELVSDWSYYPQNSQSYSGNSYQPGNGLSNNPQGYNPNNPPGGGVSNNANTPNNANNPNIANTNAGQSDVAKQFENAFKGIGEGISEAATNKVREYDERIRAVLAGAPQKSGDTEASLLSDFERLTGRKWSSDFNIDQFSEMIQKKKESSTAVKALVEDMQKPENEKYGKNLIEISKQVESAPPMNPQCRLALNVPAAYNEERNVLNYLESAANQSIDPKLYEINLFVNGRKENQGDVDNTVARVNEFKAAHPDMVINILHDTYENTTENPAPKIGYFRRVPNDIAIMRAHDRDKGINDLLLVSHDADTVMDNPAYLESIIGYNNSNPKEKIVAMGQDYSEEEKNRYPASFVARRLWQFMDMCRIGELNDPVSGARVRFAPKAMGNNSFMSAMDYASVGGYHTADWVAEDLNIATAISNYNRDSSVIGWSNSKNLRVRASSRRDVDAYSKNTPLVGSYDDFESNENVRNQSNLAGKEQSSLNESEIQSLLENREIPYQIHSLASEVQLQLNQLNNVVVDRDNMIISDEAKRISEKVVRKALLVLGANIDIDWSDNNLPRVVIRNTDNLFDGLTRPN